MLFYLRIWWLCSLQSAKIALESRFGVVLFLIGKTLRFLLFLLFILFITIRVEQIAGYTVWEMVLFFAAFNLVDDISQLCFREVYRFRKSVVSGDFDYTLTKPISPLFRSLLGGVDILDLPLFFLSVALLIFALVNMQNTSFLYIGTFLLLMGNALLIATAVHIFVLALGILTTEVDNTLWLYRDLAQMGRIPVDVYKEPLRGFITFVIPVGIMMTFPAKALMGMLSLQHMLLAFVIGGVLLLFAFQFWKFSLKRYASASS